MATTTYTQVGSDADWEKVSTGNWTYLSVKNNGVLYEAALGNNPSLTTISSESEPCVYISASTGGHLLAIIDEETP